MEFKHASSLVVVAGGGGEFDDRPQVAQLVKPPFYQEEEEEEEEKDAHLFDDIIESPLSMEERRRRAKKEKMALPPTLCEDAGMASSSSPHDVQWHFISPCSSEQSSISSPFLDDHGERKCSFFGDEDLGFIADQDEPDAEQDLESASVRDSCATRPSDVMEDMGDDIGGGDVDLWKVYKRELQDAVRVVGGHAYEKKVMEGEQMEEDAEDEMDVLTAKDRRKYASFAISEEDDDLIDGKVEYNSSRSSSMQESDADEQLHRQEGADTSDRENRRIGGSRWRRLKNTQLTAAAASRPTVVASTKRMQKVYSKLKLRGRALSSSGFNTPYDPEEDDGDFSSDDEGYTKRDSEIEPASFSSSSRLSLRTSFLTSRLSLVGSGSFRGSIGINSVRDKLNKLPRFRTSSSQATVTSEVDCRLSSPTIAGGETPIYQKESIQSAPADISLDAVPPTHQSHHHHQMQLLKLKASVCASKAAGYWSAASSEAARKIKAKGLTFRTSKASSETEEETDSSYSVHEANKPTTVMLT